ncbi:MAG: response regulator [Acidimicrobiales bacterium]
MARIVVASDVALLRREISAVAKEPGTEIIEVDSAPAVIESASERPPDLVIADMQVGNMGAMALCLELRLRESYGELPRIAVLMLLDRRPDVHLAKRSGAEGWLVKPIDPLRLRSAIRQILKGGTFEDDSYLPVPSRVDEPSGEHRAASPAL